MTVQPSDVQLQTLLVRERAETLRRAAATTPRQRFALRKRLSSALVASRLRSAPHSCAAPPITH